MPITPLYEYLPLGFKTLQRHLSNRGFEVKLVNLSTVLLRYPKLEFDTLIEALDVKLLGLDLRWMVHIQGSLAAAEQVKNVRPDTPVIVDGISSTSYADQLIRYPFIDVVMKGCDTHEPMAELLNAIKQEREPAGVPNLLWESAEGVVRENRFSHKPSTFGCGIDWSETPSEVVTDTFPIREFVSTQIVRHRCCGRRPGGFRPRAKVHVSESRGVAATARMRADPLTSRATLCATDHSPLRFTGSDSVP